MPVVTFNHIPFFSSFDGVSGYRDAPPAPTLITVNGKTVFRHTVSNAGAVLAVVRKHRHGLALGGHTHAGGQIDMHWNISQPTIGQRTRDCAVPSRSATP
jgi:hypothetical protein